MNAPSTVRRTALAVEKALCETCRGNLEAWMARKEDAESFDPCKSCVQRVIDTVLNAGSAIEVARDRLAALGLLANTPFGIEIPSVSNDLLQRATEIHPAVRRMILRIVARYGTTALVEDVWLTAQRYSILENRLPNYTPEVAEQLLLPNDAHVIETHFFNG